MFANKLLVIAALLTGGALAAGCTKGTAPPGMIKVATDGHSHDGWWCDEHGMPEEVCAQCNVKLVADFKAKGDWCEEHQRPDSQCFIHHPEKEAEFAAQYEAKYGKKPPELSESGEKPEPKNDEKK